eukprot:scaffold1174_cov281-Chaetoceros_neogracile.AAC.8
MAHARRQENKKGRIFGFMSKSSSFRWSRQSKGRAKTKFSLLINTAAPGGRRKEVGAFDKALLEVEEEETFPVSSVVRFRFVAKHNHQCLLATAGPRGPVLPGPIGPLGGLI